MKTFIKLAALVALVSVACVSVAQGGGGGGGQGRGFMRMGQGGGVQGGMQLVNRKDVQADLKLTADQIKQIDDLRAKQREDMQAMRDNQQSGTPDPEAMRAAFKKMNDEYTAKLNAILTPDQQKRVHEIGIQLAKNRAIMDEGVQKDLAITSDQKSKIDDLQKKQQEAMQSLFEKMRNQEIDRTEFQDSMKKNNEIMDTELGKILTPDQASKLKELGGAPFTATEQPRGGRGGGGGGTGGGGGRAGGGF